MSQLWALLVSASVVFTRSICLDDYSSLCIDASPPSTSGAITFNVTCAPSPGSTNLTWCGFGFSRNDTSTMFPSSIFVLQLGASNHVFLEDRDAEFGYQLPPCFASQASTFHGGSMGADGALRGSWTRQAIPTAAQRAAGYVDLVGSVTAIAASSSDGARAAAACSDYMVPHVFVVPGTPFSFPPSTARRRE
jgi:hypothetical protein